VLDAGAELRSVQENLGAANAGQKLKAAAAEQREAIDAVLTIAEEELGASGATLDRISETLHGTAGDEAIAETVRAGRVEREGQAAGLGGALIVPPARPGKAKPETKQDTKAAEASARKRHRAERAVEQAGEKLAAAEAAEKEARARMRAAEKELKAAKAAHDGAQHTLERARDGVERAREKLDELS
jgi:hypothetical protein